MALDISRPNDLRACWMPFTANRQFKKNPRLLQSAEGMYYTSVDGRRILDSSAGLWCCNAGHRSPRIVKAVQDMVHELDFAPSFQFGHPSMFELANRMMDILPDHMAHVMFTNSGSEAVDTALKIAIAYHRARGEGQRFRLIGRERGYHGVNFGGVSVGGIVNNRKVYGALLAGVDHMRHTHLPEKNAFSRGQPEHGAELADDLERIAMLHGPETIAAVIVEPLAGSTGVLIPPKGYLERLRSICDRHGILLIFDEVITGFGRLGSPFAAAHFDVKPDMITCAKGLTNGVIPMGAAVCTAAIHDAFMQGPEYLIELFHGYTYSGNPVASAAGLAALETYREDGIFENARKMAPVFEDSVHALADHPHVIDIRNEGMVAAIELEPCPGEPTRRASDVMRKAFERGLMLRTTGDIIALSPPLIATQAHLDELFGILSDILKDAD
ncbi:MAG: aspartate aminotransferase family protein [Rhodobacteraceae bacterium]|nr:aspartate aminotransferase family protein [Paracoccaceae bacterium]